MIIVKVNNLDRSDHIVVSSLQVQQNLTSQVDTANFSVRKIGSRYFIPIYFDDVEIYDSEVKIFGGKILQVTEAVEAGSDALLYNVQCVDHTYEMDKQLASRVYQHISVKDIIADLITSYCPGFTAQSVTSTFIIEKIVFNQVPISTCLKRLAEIIRYDWYVDENRGLHFFSKETNVAPFDLTDSNGNYVYNTLKRNSDGSQIVNRVKVRGGEYDGAAYTDIITVKGNDSKSFKLPYKFSNLQVWVDAGAGYVAKNVGIDFIDDFTTKDVLHSFQEQTIRFNNSLLDGNRIKFTGNPKIRVFAAAEDPNSVAQYGRIEKLIRDDNIQSNAVARRRAAAELYAYSNSIVDASFYTFTPGLRVGMILNIQSDNRDNDDDLIIKSLTFRTIDPTSFGYQAQCISTKQSDLIDLLQKILEPQPLSSDEVETSEEIFTDTEEMSFEEETDFILPVEDWQNLALAENTLLNPVDPANVKFVLSPYTPTGQADVKRPGRLGISLKVY